ncbi:hypothetical protein F4679DRAFT_574201 [Xylaria curta]|nr:hypothetical protein F4679DRAFT_574201 [Xylaria curta]
MDSQNKYNLFQQIYCLSVAANIVSQHEGSEETLQNAMKQSLDKVLPVLSGDWAVSWGPRVFKARNKDLPGGGPDNVWFAAVSQSQKVCVVAIAGTSPNSWADMQQNFGTHKVVDFNAWVEQWSPEGIPKPQTHTPDSSSAAAYCAKGTCIGVWNVLSNLGAVAGELLRIDQYLDRLDSSYTIVITGHSLGGALAPIVALGLCTANTTGAYTNNIKVLASAGVSPGNEKLALDFATTFPKEPESAESYQVYNMNYYNEFDIVPQAWSIRPNDDRNLYNILSKILRFSEDLYPWANTLLKIAIRLSKASKIQYVPLPGQRFTGPPLPEQIKSWKEAKDVMREQHMRSYWRQIGITDFMKRFEYRFRLENNPGEERAEEQ